MVRKAGDVLPLLLTGPPAAGKSTTARALAMSCPRGAVVDVDDIRQLVVSGHVAPWDGEEGRRQQRLGVENACDVARRLGSAGIDVLICDVVDDATLPLYRRLLPDLVVVRLSLPLDEARRRAASRPVHLTNREFEDLHTAAERDHLEVDVVLPVGELTPEQQTAAVREVEVWSLS